MRASQNKQGRIVYSYNSSVRNIQKKKKQKHSRCDTLLTPTYAPITTPNCVVQDRNVQPFPNNPRSPPPTTAVLHQPRASTAFSTKPWLPTWHWTHARRFVSTQPTVVGWHFTELSKQLTWVMHAMRSTEKTAHTRSKLHTASTLLGGANETGTYAPTNNKGGLQERTYSIYLIQRTEVRCLPYFHFFMYTKTIFSFVPKGFYVPFLLFFRQAYIRNVLTATSSRDLV